MRNFFDGSIKTSKKIGRFDVAQDMLKLCGVMTGERQRCAELSDMLEK